MYVIEKINNVIAVGILVIRGTVASESFSIGINNKAKTNPPTVNIISCHILYLNN